MSLVENIMEKWGQMRLSPRFLIKNYKSDFEQNIGEITINKIS